MMTDTTPPANDGPDIPYSIRREAHDGLKRDIPKLIRELIAAGWSAARIAYRCSVDEKTVRNWRDGHGEPNYSQAIIIIGLHHCWVGSGKGRPDVVLGITEIPPI